MARTIFLARDRPHGAAHKAEIGDAQHERHALNGRRADDHAVGQARRFHAFAQLGRIIFEAEGIQRTQTRKQFLPGAFVRGIGDPLLRRQLVVKAAVRGRPSGFFQNLS